MLILYHTARGRRDVICPWQMRERELYFVADDEA
jgi:hypothetical protein